MTETKTPSRPPSSRPKREPFLSTAGNLIGTGAPKEDWTHRLLPSITRWLKKPPMALTFHLTEMLTGHGSYQTYLHKYDRADDSACVHCGHPDDDARHTIFCCPYWAAKRARMMPFPNGRPPTPGDVSDLLCGPVSVEEAAKSTECVRSGEQRILWHGVHYHVSEGRRRKG